MGSLSCLLASCGVLLKGERGKARQQRGKRDNISNSRVNVMIDPKKIRESFFQRHDRQVFVGSKDIFWLRSFAIPKALNYRRLELRTSCVLSLFSAKIKNYCQLKTQNTELSVFETGTFPKYCRNWQCSSLSTEVQNEKWKLVMTWKEHHQPIKYIYHYCFSIITSNTSVHNYRWNGTTVNNNNDNNDDNEKNLLHCNQ